MALCFGDSNTFGLWVDESESYPAQLRELLNAGVPDEPHRVINLGVPGQTSLHIVRALPQELARIRPDLLLVTSGVNNSWAWDESSAEDPTWIDELRLVKTARLLRERFGDPEEERLDSDSPPFLNRLGERVTAPGR